MPVAVFHLMYQLDEEVEERIRFVSQMDLIGQAIAAAVSQSILAPALRRPSLTKPIPTVSLGDLVFNKELREGRLPARFRQSRRQARSGVRDSGAVPTRTSLSLLGSRRMNGRIAWGGCTCASKEYFEGVDKAYGVSRSMHSIDGADHFRFRKSMNTAYSRKTLTRRLDEVYDLARAHMARWEVGATMPVQTMLRPFVNAQTSPLLANIDTQRRDC